MYQVVSALTDPSLLWFILFASAAVWLAFRPTAGRGPPPLTATIDTASLIATLDNMDQGVVMIDAAGLVRVCNERAMVLLDLPRDLMKRQPSFEQVRQYQLSIDDIGASHQTLQARATNDGFDRTPHSDERKGPNDTVIEIRTVPLPDGGIVRTFTDVTLHKRRETALAENEARRRALADALPQMIWVARPADGTVTYANERFYAYFGNIGLERADRIAAHHPEDRERAARAWSLAEAAGEAMEVEARWRRKDGAYLWHKLILAPVRRDGVVVEWLGSALDIDDIVQARNALREKTDLLQFAQEAAGAGLFDWDLEHGLAHLSRESLNLFGLREDRTTAVGLDEFWSLIHPDDHATIRLEAERAKVTRTNYRVEFRVERSGAPDRWVLGTGRVVTDGSGHPSRIVGLNLDITERKHVEETLRVSGERLALALASGSDGLWDWEIETGKCWYSDQWHTMLGYAPGELGGDVGTWERLIHPEDRDRAITITNDHFEKRTPAYECEHRLRRKDGEWGWVLSRGKVVQRSADGRPLRIVGTHIDIDARKAAEQRIAYMACHDALTDLPNRVMFRDRLEQRLAGIALGGETCAILCLDLDRFKAINDSLGHLAGDALLREVAVRLQTTLAPQDLLARLGGDEFAIVVHDASFSLHLEELAQRMICATGRPFTIGEQEVEVGVSIGVALAPDHGSDAETLFRRADLAMYRAKAEGANGVRWFEPAMDEEATERRRLQQDLHHAVLHDEFTLHYQPQMLCASNEIIGFEALVRWNHPTQGLIPPARFIQLTEESGLIVPLGTWVLRTACAEATRWMSPLRVAVNISPRQFQQADLPGLVLSILAETGLSPARLELEITENLLINDMARALGILRRLKAIGVRIAMDDFGTGYSSLATLQAFPFDTLKIDRTFVQQLQSSAQAKVIVRTIIGLGRSLAIGVVAEGVETETQRRFLSDEGCDELQGYLIGKPEPIKSYAAWTACPKPHRIACNSPTDTSEALPPETSKSSLDRGRRR